MGAFLILLILILTSCEKQEYYVSYYPNGIKKEEVPLENGIPNGNYKKWSITGFVSERGFYKDSLPDGKWTFYAKDNKPYRQGYFTKGKKSGVWTIFNEQGKILEENSCQEANAEGVYKSYSKEGKLLIYQECKFGKKAGVFMSYYPSGTLHKVGNFEENLRSGLWVDYFANGKIMKIERWIANMRNGEWLKFGHEGEIVAQAEFIDGSGTFEDTTWSNNRIHGELKRELGGGEYVRVETYSRGAKLSSTDYLKDSGKPLSESFWKNGKKDSSWRTWWRSGALKDSVFYKDGNPVGKHFYYDSTGKEYIRDNILLIK